MSNDQPVSNVTEILVTREMIEAGLKILDWPPIEGQVLAIVQAYTAMRSREPTTK